jgi:hypothetical protein
MLKSLEAPGAPVPFCWKEVPLTMIPEWMSLIETLTFLVLLGTVIYNRIISVKRTREDVTELKIAFTQYQKDMSHYLQVCEMCRSEVRKHHEGVTAEHVTPALREQISNLVKDVSDIKKFLMEHPPGV